MFSAAKTTHPLKPALRSAPKAGSGASRQKKTPRISHVWTRKQLALLGKISDGALAKQLGITTSAVFLKRSLAGIPSSRPFKSLKWGPREIALLGKYPDTEVARRLNTTYKTVFNKRLALGLECYARRSRLWHAWTQEEIAMLGTRFDREVAERIGVTQMCVTTKRSQLKIPAFKKRKGPNRPRKSLADWTRKEIALLGKFTDQEIGDQLNLGHTTVRLKRISLGIPPCRRGKTHRPGLWIPQVVARLGRDSDASIAKDIGVSTQRVNQKRMELGIPSARAKQ